MKKVLIATLAALVTLSSCSYRIQTIKKESKANGQEYSIKYKIRDITKPTPEIIHLMTTTKEDSALRIYSFSSGKEIMYIKPHTKNNYTYPHNINEISVMNINSMNGLNNLSEWYGRDSISENHFKEADKYWTKIVNDIKRSRGKK